QHGAPASPAANTVTFDIGGLHCAACVSTVHDALVRVKGVKKADVSLDKQQAVVTYDPEATSPSALIQVVQNTPHAMGPGMKYTARLRQPVTGHGDHPMPMNHAQMPGMQHGDHGMQMGGMSMDTMMATQGMLMESQRHSQAAMGAIDQAAGAIL